MSKPVIAIDFDGVIHKYSKGWADGSIYDEPVEGCKEALEKLRETYYVIIFSTRNYDRVVNGEFQSDQVDSMERWLHRYNIPYDDIYEEPHKPLCKLFIDDNAYRFEGDWIQALKDVNSLSSGSFGA